MQSFVIDLISSEDVCSFRGRAQDGCIAETFACDLLWPDGEQRRSYLKCFTKDRYLGVVNEITGYVIARACHLPVPEHAGIVQLSATLIDSLGMPVDEIYPYAFAVSEAPGSSPNSRFNNLPHELTVRLTRQLLSGWHGAPRLIAFDDWAANEDRNLGNFLIKDEKNAFIIDHSNLPVRLMWTDQCLDPSGIYKNQMMAIMTYEHGLPFDAAFVTRAAKSHPDAFASAKTELDYWWGAFLGSDPARLDSIDNFFQTRAKQGEERLSHTLHLLAV
jgi:hypothetical protein